jgi:hypothetical protein
MLPFLATFAVGVFIASFFVSVGPNFGFSERRMKRFQEMQRLRIENDELRQENDRLRNKLDMKWSGQMDLEQKTQSWNFDSPPDPPPPPRPAPRVHR